MHARKLLIRRHNIIDTSGSKAELSRERNCFEIFVKQLITIALCDIPAWQSGCAVPIRGAECSLRDISSAIPRI